MNVAMCSESKRKTHFNIEAKLAVVIGSDTYQHQIAITRGSLRRWKKSAHVSTHTQMEIR